MLAMLGPHCVDAVQHCNLLAWHSLKVDAEIAGPSDCDGLDGMELNCNRRHVLYHNAQSDLLTLEALSSPPLSPPLTVNLLPSYH